MKGSGYFYEQCYKYNEMLIKLLLNIVKLGKV